MPTRSLSLVAVMILSGCNLYQTGDRAYFDANATKGAPSSTFALAAEPKCSIYTQAQLLRLKNLRLDDSDEVFQITDADLQEGLVSITVAVRAEPTKLVTPALQTKNEKSYFSCEFDFVAKDDSSLPLNSTEDLATTVELGRALTLNRLDRHVFLMEGK